MEATGERFLPEQMSGIITAEHLNRYRFVTSQIDLAGKTILDVASGEGYGSNILAQKAKLVYGVDISEEAILHAKTKYKRDNLLFQVGSAFNLPIEDKSIDIVVSFETIEHHDKHEEMMLEIKRILKTDGLLIISSPNKAEYTDKANHHNHYHVKELYTNEFQALLNKYFKNVQMFWQRYLSGSCIMPVYSTIQCVMPINVANEEIEDFAPVYDLAIATDGENYKTPYSSIIFNSEPDIIAIQEKYNSVLDSHAFKLGNFLLKPLYWLKRLI